MRVQHIFHHDITKIQIVFVYLVLIAAWRIEHPY